MGDWSEDPEAQPWIRHVRDEVAPAMRDSFASVSLFPTNEDVDVKFAVETGLAILMDKPLIVVVAPGTKVPGKLVMVADRIVEADLSKEGESERLAGRLAGIMREIDKETNDE